MLPQLLTTLAKKAFENNVGAYEMHFLLKAKCFLPAQGQISSF